MKLLFIFTGGTIGSTLCGDVISTDSTKSYKIIDEYKKRYGMDFEYDTEQPYTELSENNTGAHIRALCACVKENAKRGYDGIIITHGTDTLQYTAAAVGYSLGLDSVPVCIVSSNRPIEDERANGLENLRGAVLFIKDGCGRGAFVVYRNGNSDIMRVHRAARLIGAKAYSDDVSSVFSQVYGHFEGEHFVKNESYRESPDMMPPLDMISLTDDSESIGMLTPYPGMRYPDDLCGLKYIIANTFHSGTLNTKSDKARAFFKKANEAGVTVFAAGTYGGANYESAEEYGGLFINTLNNISPVAVYIKLWALDCMGLDPKKYMNISLSGDIMPK